MELGESALMEMNPLELGKLLDELYIELSETECSVDLIDDLERLIWLYHRSESLSHPSFQGSNYLTFMQLYAKLGYLYQIAGDLDKALSFFEIAVQHGNSIQNSFDLDYVKELPFKSRMGCEIH